MRFKIQVFHIFQRLRMLTNPMKPSHHGEDCLYNGDHIGFECCCDECDYYLTCFPDWKEYIQ